MKRSALVLLLLLFPLVLTAGTTTVFNVKDPAYGATGDGTTDDGVAITAAANALQSAGGGTLYFPPGTYKIYSSGTTYRYLTAFGGPDASHPFNGISLIADHATLAIDPTNTAITAESWGAIFQFANAVNVKIDGFNVTGPHMDITTTSVKGVTFALFYDGVVNVSMPNNTVQGVTAGVNVAGTANATNPSRDFDIGILDVKEAWYGFAGQYSPNNVRIGLLRTDTIHRSYIVYGVKNHTVNVQAKDAYSIDCYLWVPSQNINIENVTLNYTSNDDYVNSGDGNHRIGIVYSAHNPGTVRNVRLNVNVTFGTPVSGHSSGASVVEIQKWDTADHGYVLENLTISGVIRGAASYVGLPVVGTYPDDVWGQGDTWRNIRLENLRVEGATHMLFNLGALKGPFTISGVSSDSAIYFRESPSDPNPPHNGSYAIINSDFPNMNTMLTNQARSLDPVIADVSQSIPAGWTSHTVSQDLFATSSITYTLPPAKAGLDYTFVRTTSVPVSVQPNGSEIIRGYAAGQAVSLSSVGSAIHLRCLFSQANPSFGTSVPVWEVIP